MASLKPLTAAVIVGLVIAVVITGTIAYYTLRVHGSGKIKVVGAKAYSDPGATLEVSAIDWGVISPGGISQATIYLKSTSTVPVNMTLTTENWSPPAAAQYMTLTWNLSPQTLSPGEVRAVILTLRVSQNIVGVIDFSFDVVITAAG